MVSVVFKRQSVSKNNLIKKVQNFNLNKNINNDSIYFRIIFSAMGLVSLSVLEELIFEKSMTSNIII